MSRPTQIGYIHKAVWSFLYQTKYVVEGFLVLLTAFRSLRTCLLTFEKSFFFVQILKYTSRNINIYVECNIALTLLTILTRTTN